MKPAECRRLALERTLEELAAAAEALSEERIVEFEIIGEDDGERLTHVLLASRIRERVDGGEELREAFRAVMASVRDVMSND